MTTLDPVARLLLELFDELDRDRLDLHTFSALADLPALTGDNAPGALERVLEAVGHLVERGWLRDHGSDFYSRTEDGRLQLAPPREITLYTRQGCHLCEEAKSEILPLLREFGATLRVVDIDGDPILRERYRNDIPVIFLASRKVAKHRLDTTALRRQLAEACPP